jgi:hypothetical protein
VHFVGLSVVNWLFAVHGMNNIKFNCNISLCPSVRPQYPNEKVNYSALLICRSLEYISDTQNMYAIWWFSVIEHNQQISINLSVM